MIKISIDAVPSSNNKYQGQGSKNKAIKEYQAEKGTWKQWIWVQRHLLKTAGELPPGLPYQEATIIMHYHFRTKTRRDPDNYSGKFILDGLKENGFIADDSFANVDIFPLADFGNVRDSVDIYVINAKQLSGFVRKLLQIHGQAANTGESGSE
ncbi:hypothetical protein ACTFSJ_27645 [Bacillus cereus group sp. MYBK12-2]|uniref:hypothetical protein n=1 Tax=Bacillus cereus group sp. MYBK12-2 TaxID=3450689 RepID=UPI0032F688EB|nr:hypothetical protein [Bacillus pacificus]HDR7653549.1 hypothetical protein [Bacillus pacificus]